MHDGCRNCKYELQDEHLEPCFHCDGTKQGDKYISMTNADRIRAMSDAELAVTIMCPNETGMANIECDRSDNCNCCECTLKWLQSEAEVEA